MHARKIFAGVAATVLATTLVACDLEEETTGQQSADESSSSQEATDDSAEPKAKESKKPADKNVVGSWKILNKPNPQKGDFGMFGTVKLQIENVGDSPETPWLEIRLTNGKNLVTTYDCVGDEIRPGETTTLSCESFDDYAKWTAWEVKNAF